MLFHAEIRHPRLDGKGRVYYGTVGGAPTDTGDRLRFERNSLDEAVAHLTQILAEDWRALTVKGVVHRSKAIGMFAAEDVPLPEEILAPAQLRRHWFKPTVALKGVKLGDASEEGDG